MGTVGDDSQFHPLSGQRRKFARLINLGQIQVMALVTRYPDAQHASPKPGQQFQVSPGCFHENATEVANICGLVCNSGYKCLPVATSDGHTSDLGSQKVGSHIGHEIAAKFVMHFTSRF